MNGAESARLDESGSNEEEYGFGLESPRASVPAPGTRLWGFFLVLLSALMFSLMSLMVKMLTIDGIPPLQAVLCRSVVQLFLTFATMLCCKVPLCGAMSKEDRRWLVARGVVGTFTLAGFYLSVQVLSLADASVCMFTAPVWTVFLAGAVLKEPVRKVHVAAAVISIIGVIFIARPASIFAMRAGPCMNTTSTNTSTGKVLQGMPKCGAPNVNMSGETRSLGVALGLSSALLQAVAFITMRRIRHLHYLLSVWSISWGGVVLGLVFVLASSQVVIPQSMRTWAMSFALGGVGYWGQVFLNLGLRTENAGPASIVRNFDIVLAFVWQVLFLEDPVQWTSLVGGAIITFAALAVAVDKLKPWGDTLLEFERVKNVAYAKVDIDDKPDVD